MRRRGLSPAASGSLNNLGRFASIVDADFVYVGASDDYAALLGFRRLELMGRSAWEMSGRAEADRVAVAEQLRRDGAVSGLTTIVTRSLERIPWRHVTRAVNGGELYVTVGDFVTTSTSELAIGPDSWLTKDEAVAYSRRSSSTIDRAVRAGVLDAGGTAHRRLYRRAALDAWLAGPARLMLVALALIVLVIAGWFALASGHLAEQPAHVGADVRDGIVDSIRSTARPRSLERHHGRRLVAERFELRARGL